MEQSLSWEVNRSSFSQESLWILCNLKVRYCIHKCSPPVPITSPCPIFALGHRIFLSSRPCEIFWNLVSFSGEVLFGPRPPTNLTYHLSAAVRDGWLSIFAAILLIRMASLQPQNEDAPFWGDIDLISLCNNHQNKYQVFSIIAIIKGILNTTDKIFKFKKIVFEEHAVKV